MPEESPTNRASARVSGSAGIAADCSTSGLRTVVHELSNLLDGATRMLHVARESKVSLEGPSLEAVCAALDHACELLRALPAMTSEIRIDTATLDSIPDQIRQAVELLRPMAQERGIEIVEYAESALSGVPSSPLHAVLVNVVRNAIEAVGDGGRIEVRAAHEPEHAPERAMVRIEVIDNGAGPSNEMGERVFEPGATTKSHGAGIGLSLVRDTIRSLGGNVRLERLSEQGGAKLTIVYPVPRSPVHCPVRNESGES